MAAVRPATVALRKRLITVLRNAGRESLSTPELCQRTGINNFEHHAYVLPQLRWLARAGIITRTAHVPGGAAYWRLNPTDQDDAAFNARLEAHSQKENRECRDP